MKSRKTENRKNLLRGRREKFVLDAKIAAMIRQMALCGLTNREMALILDTSETTFTRRLKEQHDTASAVGEESILDALNRARECADAEVTEALFRRAVGCRIGKTVLPPDVTACIFWLKNRQPERWRDLQKAEITAQIKKPPSLNIVIEKDVSGGKK